VNSLPQPPAVTRTDRAHMSLGALRSTIDHAIRQLDAGVRADRIALGLRTGKEYAEGIRLGTVHILCPQCGRSIHSQAEEALINRVGCCSVCSGEAKPLETAGLIGGVFTPEDWEQECARS
jgi:hypothetical protein